MSFTSISHTSPALFAATHPQGATQAATNPETDFWGEEGFSFESFLDAVNPLQQLPIVSTIYRALTDDTISTGSRLAGGALFGGPMGFASALLNTVIEDTTGKDIGANVLSLLGGDTASATTAFASSSSALTEDNKNIAAYNRSAYLAYSKATKLI